MELNSRRSLRGARLARSPRAGERGFALLVVFLLAAGIMISLYLELPRVAFESQRNREEMLVERGEQYSRAIEVYYRKNKRYPAKLEDLENTNNLRFLRRRYKDPLTGKDEWRMIHMGAAGQLADSLVEKPGAAGQQLAGLNGQQAGAPGAGLTGAASTTGAPSQPAYPGAPPNPEDVNIIKLRDAARAGARGLQPGMPGYDPNNPNAGQGQQVPLDSNGNPISDPNQPQQFPNGQFQQAQQNGNPFNTNGQQQQPVLNFPGQPGLVNPNGVSPGTINFQSPQGFSPGGQLQGQLGAQLGQNPVQAGFGTNPALTAINSQLRNQAGYLPPGAANGYNSSGYGANQIPPGAIRLPDGSFKLQDGTTMLPDGTIKYPNGVTPTPGPQQPPGIGSVSGFAQSGLGGAAGQPGFGTAIKTSPQSAGQSFGGAGIAGVASTQAGVGIKRYNDRAKYKEWEFVFDYRKPKTKPTTGVGGANGLNQSNLNLSSPGGGFNNSPSPAPPPR